MSAAFAFGNSTVSLSKGTLILKENECYSSSHLLYTDTTTIIMENGSTADITQNKMYSDATVACIQKGSWNISSDSKLLVTENIGLGGFSFTLFSMDVTLEGTVIVANNTINDYGALNILGSRVWFHGDLEVVSNRGETGAISALDSDIFITDRATFVDNVAEYGGALTLASSVMFLSTDAKVDFTRNQAKELGGAIYVPNPRNSYLCDFLEERVASCSIQVLPDNSTTSCQFFSLTFNQNKAEIAGNAIYGDKTSACEPKSGGDLCERCPYLKTSDIYQYNGVNDSSDLSHFTSDPTRVCFCENGIPNCYKVTTNIKVHPGERFNLSLATVGYGLGTVPGAVIARGIESVSEDRSDIQEIRKSECQDVWYSVVSENDREQIALAVDTLSFIRSQENAQLVVDFQQTGHLTNLYLILDSAGSPLPEAFFHIPVFVEVDLLPCPVGFQPEGGKCVCHQILQKHNMTCFFSNRTGFILRPPPYWIGLYNDTNPSIFIHPHCPFDYCQSEHIGITAESQDTQCQHQRSGILCGSCREGLSMILGSSECETCSNLHLLYIGIFILMGVALVTMVTLLNMTVTVGTLNGLILLANILQANKTTFLPPNQPETSAVIFLSAFISWLNLDLGIPICFFDGLTTYVKTWLQFVFPLYILALVGAIIIASKYSRLVTRLFGTNAVSVLATLVFLCYTKILRIHITAFSFTTLTGSQGYRSVVWLADGNIKYFESKHAILFLVALLVLLLLGVPYTVTLTAAPWIQRSRFKWVSSLYNRFKPLFDAYMGPYKDSHRYWTGMLLLARVVLIVLFSSIANTNTVAGPQLNLLLLVLSSSTLIALTAVLKPYKTRLLNGLELFHLAMLLMFASSNLYVSSIGTGSEARAYIYIFLVGICFLVFLGICVGHIWYRVRKAVTERRPEPPQREEEDWHPVWWRARVCGTEKKTEDVTVSTAGATNTASPMKGEGWNTETLLWNWRPLIDTTE